MNDLVIEYVLTNSLPLKIWLNSYDDTTIQQTINNFTIYNLAPEFTNLYFTSSGQNVPIYDMSLGLGFFNNKALFLSNNSIFRKFDSYTIIAITLDIPQEFSQYYSFNKTLNNKPFLTLQKETTNISFSNTILNVNQSYFNEDKEVLVISHNLPLGRVRTLTSKKYTEEKGRVFSGFINNFILGNNTELNSPLNTYLLHFLVFIPEINDINLIEELINRLPVTRGVRGNSGFTIGTNLENYNLDFFLYKNYNSTKNNYLKQSYSDIINLEKRIIIILSQLGIFENSFNTNSNELNIEKEIFTNLVKFINIYEGLLNENFILNYDLNNPDLIIEFIGLFSDLIILLVFNVFYNLVVSPQYFVKLVNLYKVLTFTFNAIANTINPLVFYNIQLETLFTITLINSIMNTISNLNFNLLCEVLLLSIYISANLRKTMDNFYQNLNIVKDIYGIIKSRTNIGSINFDNLFTNIDSAIINLYPITDWFNITTVEWYRIDRTIWFYYLNEQPYSEILP